MSNSSQRGNTYFDTVPPRAPLDIPSRSFLFKLLMQVEALSEASSSNGYAAQLHNYIEFVSGYAPSSPERQWLEAVNRWITSIEVDEREPLILTEWASRLTKHIFRALEEAPPS